MSSIVLDLRMTIARIDSVMPQDQNENMAVSLALAGLAFVLTLIIGRPIVTYLRQRNFAKKVRVEGPERHVFEKSGTPTMGGIMITITVVTLTAAFNLVGRFSMVLPIGVLVACATLGAIDDRMNL